MGKSRIFSICSCVDVNLLTTYQPWLPSDCYTWGEEPLYYNNKRITFLQLLCYYSFNEVFSIIIKNDKKSWNEFKVFYHWLELVIDDRRAFSSSKKLVSSLFYEKQFRFGALAAKASITQLLNAFHIMININNNLPSYLMLIFHCIKIPF